jgi:hypothetical protein
MKNKQEEQFTIIPHSLMGSKDLTDQDKLTLGIILSFINNGKECYIGNDTLGEMLGITKNAASIRINRLEKIGCVALRYTYKEGKKLVDKRYITLLSTTPQVSSVKQQVSSHKLKGIVSQTKGSRPTDEEVSSKDGGIIQPYYTSVLNNLEDNLPHKVLHKENPVELSVEDKQIVIPVIKNSKAPEGIIDLLIVLIKEGAGFLTPTNKEQLKSNKHYFNKIGVIQPILNQL